MWGTCGAGLTGQVSVFKRCVTELLRMGVCAGHCGNTAGTCCSCGTHPHVCPVFFLPSRARLLRIGVRVLGWRLFLLSFLLLSSPLLFFLSYPFLSSLPSPLLSPHSHPLPPPFPSLSIPLPSLPFLSLLVTLKGHQGSQGMGLDPRMVQSRRGPSISWMHAN